MIFALFFLLNTFLVNAEACSCGSFEEGTYDYFVRDGSGGCCRGVSSGDASFTTWVPGPGRTWIVDTITEISHSDAVRACCPPA